MVSKTDFESVSGDRASVPLEIRKRLEGRRDEMVGLLGELVEIESASDDAAGLDEMADRLEGLFGPFGTLTSHPIGPEGCRHLVLSVDGADERLAPTLVLGHYDTVWARGSLERLPFRVDERGHARGPGCFDMKGGLVLLFYALAELHAVGVAPLRPVRILFSCDEEVRSPTSRGLIAELGADAALALVLEGPLPGGVVKIARKGSCTYRLHVEGRAAHAGVEPHKGVSAVVELAHQVLALAALNDHDKGTSVNVGVVRAGTRSNVVAASADAEIDVRAPTMAEAKRVEQAVGGLRAVLPEAKVSITADLARPPMEPTPATWQLFGVARAVAARLGISDLRDGSTGGVSDGNLVAALGVPTLDGLGPLGGGAHADDEHVEVDSLPWRAALLAGLLVEA